MLPRNEWCLSSGERYSRIIVIDTLICLAGSIPPKQVGSTCAPKLPQGQLTVTVVSVPVAVLTTLGGFVVTVYPTVWNPAVAIVVSTAEVTAVLVAVDSTATRAAVRAASSITPLA